MPVGEIIITRHAAERWSERVAPCSRAEAIEAIHNHDAAIRTAADFGASLLKLPSTHRLVLSGTTVVTVTPPDHRKAAR